VSKAREVVGLVAAALLSAPLASQAAIVFTTDSATLLQGRFEFTGRSADIEYGYPTTFALVPNVSGYLWGQRGFGNKFFFGSGAEGKPIPGDPYRMPGWNDNPQSFGPFSGSYTNSGQSNEGGTRLYWLFSDWQDTGGSEGTASGKFCFSTAEADCPGVPAVPLPAAAWLLLSGLGGLGFLGRRRKAA